MALLRQCLQEARGRCGDHELLIEPRPSNKRASATAARDPLDLYSEVQMWRAKRAKPAERLKGVL